MPLMYHYSPYECPILPAEDRERLRLQGWAPAEGKDAVPGQLHLAIQVNWDRRNKANKPVVSDKLKAEFIAAAHALYT